jgi:hypothetical protein
MESKTCNVFPVMEDRPWCLHFEVRAALQFVFVRMVLIHRPTQIILIYFDGVEISTIVSIGKHAQTMAVATSIANEVSTLGLLSCSIVKPPFKV